MRAVVRLGFRSIRDTVAPQCFSFGARPREQPEGFSQRGFVEKCWQEFSLQRAGGHPLVAFMMCVGLRARRSGATSNSTTTTTSRKTEGPFSSPGQRAFSVLAFITQQSNASRTGVQYRATEPPPLIYSFAGTIEDTRRRGRCRLSGESNDTTALDARLPTNCGTSAVHHAKE